MADDEWIEDYTADEESDTSVEEYDIAVSPNDFNVLTIFSYMDSGSIRIPEFQRNFVWDIGRSSKLIESLILGLPVPQVFLYEEKKNSFLVIDGQQRLMSIYYFLKGRFPLPEKRAEIRRIFEQHGSFPDKVLQNDDYFMPFKLKLSSSLPNRENRFNRLTYTMLDDYRGQLDLRPIRVVIIKQTSPSGDDSSIYEIFNRLNTGGVNLSPQEIRASLYHSKFYELLSRLNMLRPWRRILGKPDLDLRTKDAEILLRAFALALSEESYAPSMKRFLNKFSNDAKRIGNETIAEYERVFNEFLRVAEALPEKAFIGRSGKFNAALFESIFVASCAEALRRERPVRPITLEMVQGLEADHDFVSASIRTTTSSANVRRRLSRARTYVIG